MQVYIKYVWVLGFHLFFSFCLSGFLGGMIWPMYFD